MPRWLTCHVLLIFTCPLGTVRKSKWGGTTNDIQRTREKKSRRNVVKSRRGKLTSGVDGIFPIEHNSIKKWVKKWKKSSFFWTLKLSPLSGEARARANRTGPIKKLKIIWLAGPDFTIKILRSIFQAEKILVTFAGKNFHKKSQKSKKIDKKSKKNDTKKINRVAWWI